MRKSAAVLLATLVATLGLAGSARAASLPLGAPWPLATVPLFAPEDDGEAEAAEVEGEEVEVCEETEDGVEVCTDETTASEAEASGACMLKSAEATILVLPAKDTVRLTLRYTAFAPAVVSVQYGLRGRKGSLMVGTDSRRFSRKGVFRETEKLSEAEMARANAATGFDVRVRAVNTPGHCRGLFDRELTSRRSAHGRSTWTD
jgi:hypothetical protein